MRELPPLGTPLYAAIRAAERLGLLDLGRDLLFEAIPQLSRLRFDSACQRAEAEPNQDKALQLYREAVRAWLAWRRAKPGDPMFRGIDSWRAVRPLVTGLSLISYGNPGFVLECLPLLYEECVDERQRALVLRLDANLCNRTGKDRRCIRASEEFLYNLNFTDRECILPRGQVLHIVGSHHDALPDDRSPNEPIGYVPRPVRYYALAAERHRIRDGRPPDPRLLTVVEKAAAAPESNPALHLLHAHLARQAGSENRGRRLANGLLDSGELALRELPEGYLPFLMGTALLLAGRPDEAVDHFEESARTGPSVFQASLADPPTLLVLNRPDPGTAGLRDALLKLRARRPRKRRS